MKGLNLFKLFVIGGIMSLFLASCGEDDIMVVETPPTIEFGSGLDVLTGNANLILDESFKVNLIGRKGTANLRVLRVLEDDVLVDVNRITFPFEGGANPLLLIANPESLDLTLTIQSHDIIGERTYSFVLEDVNGATNTISLKINVEGTAVTLLEGVLLNQGGPAGTGGLDLDTGTSTGSADPRAEIRDEGIDLGRPNATNWRQQISGINGSEIKYLKAGQNGLAENFSFGDIKIKEQLASLWDNGIAFTRKSADNMRDVSEVVSKDDVFIIKNGNKYYTIIVKDITVTTSDNDDRYVLDIKL